MEFKEVTINLCLSSLYIHGIAVGGQLRADKKKKEDEETILVNNLNSERR